MALGSDPAWAWMGGPPDNYTRQAPVVMAPNQFQGRPVAMAPNQLQGRPVVMAPNQLQGRPVVMAPNQLQGLPVAMWAPPAAQQQQPLPAVSAFPEPKPAAVAFPQPQRQLFVMRQPPQHQPFQADIFPQQPERPTKEKFILPRAFIDKNKVKSKPKSIVRPTSSLMLTVPSAPTARPVSPVPCPANWQFVTTGGFTNTDQPTASVMITPGVNNVPDPAPAFMPLPLPAKPTQLDQLQYQHGRYISTIICTIICHFSLIQSSIIQFYSLIRTKLYTKCE